MKKLLALVPLTLAAMLLVVPIASSGNGGDFAVGAFERASTPTNGGHTGFSAQSGPNGQSPSGYLSSTFDSSPASPAPGRIERYNVVCLAVSGSDAAIGLVPTGSPSTNAGAPRVLAVHDGGLPNGGGDLYTFYTDTAPSDCASRVGEALFTPLTGNIVVNDAP